MRLSAALLLQAVPSAAQTTTTTDVNYPTILSAAGNVTGLPGGNEFCGSARVRKPWGALTSDEQALYLEATELAIADGGVAEFSVIAADSLGQAQGEYSCAFFSWHRRLLLAYESYLRDLDERFACLTLPYYDVHTAYIQAVNGECTNMLECSGIFEAIGGAPNSTDETTLVFDGVNATGYAVSGAPYAESCDDDDNCGYIVRDDLSSKLVPSAASFGSFQSVVATSSDYATFLENIQYGVHNEVLDAVGGAFSTAVAARDVLYYSWYSALDMYLHVYHLCRIGVPVTYEQILESLEVFSNATQVCGGMDGVDAESALIMRITVDGEVVDASQHPTLGQYFGYVGSDNWNYVDIQQLGDYSYTYQLPEVLRQQILSNNDVCTGFNRAFAASYTTLNAAAIKSTTTTKTTTKTTTTKTTKIVNGKKVTTTKVTKVITKSNSTSSSSAKSTATRGQLASSYGYTYLGNFSTDNVAYGEGTIVTNGYTGYMPYYTNGEITTKHNGIVSANYSSSSSSSTTSSTAYSNTSNLVMNVTVGTSSVARNVTASVATSGSYWAWLQTAYNGLYTRFEGNLDLVATHMKLLECYTFDSVYGLSNFTSTFVTDKNLITNRVECGQRLDLVRSGLLQLAVRSTSYSASSLRFASSTVIRTIRTSYKRVTTRKVTYIRKSYTQKVQSSLESTQEALGNITVTSTSGSGDDETSTTVVDTGYLTSNTTSSTVQSARNSSAVTTTSSTTTTTTTAANVSETLSEASSGSTDLEVSGSSSTETGSETSKTGSTSEEGSTVTTTGSNGETITTTGSGGTVETTTTGSGGSIQTTTTGSGETTTTVTTGSGATSTTTGGSSTTTTGSTTTSGGSTTSTTNSGTSTTATGSATTSGGSTTSTTTSGASTSTNSGTTTSTTTGGSTTTTTGSNGETTTTTTTGSGGSIQATTTGSGGSIETITTGSGATTTTVTTGSGESTTTTGTSSSSTGSDSTTQTTTESSASGSTSTSTGTKTPGATPAATTPGATPAATTPGATPAASKPSATPAATTPSATPAATTPSSTPAATATQSETCIGVSVEGDATYCIEGPICSGAGDLPAGSLCPKKGDVAVQDCHETLSGYTNSSTCVAPQDAVCLKIKTGAWGCVFEKSTPAPTMTATEAPTPAPTKTENETSTPAPTKTETDKPTPAPTTSESEKPTPAPTSTETKTPAPTTTETKTPAPTEKPTPAPTKEGSTPAPTTAGPSTEAPTPCLTTEVPSTESPTPSPTTEIPSTDAPTSSPSTEVPSTEGPTPSPTTEVPSTDAPMPCPTTEVPTTEAPTPYPTTEVPATETPSKTPEIPTKTGTKTGTKTETTTSSNHDDDYTWQQQTQQETQQSASSSTKTFSTSYASTTAATGGVGAAAVAGIVIAVCAVVALAGFTAYRIRQRRTGDDLTPSGYYSQPATPVTRSIKL
ncbi:hypothetical protein PI124_g21202 [Phytophthora idaei]|nr:hypothetical protein PI124_g21202 [Phytophthora idaei]